MGIYASRNLLHATSNPRDYSPAILKERLRDFAENCYNYVHDTHRITQCMHQSFPLPEREKGISFVLSFIDTLISQEQRDIKLEDLLEKTANEKQHLHFALQVTDYLMKNFSLYQDKIKASAALHQGDKAGKSKQAITRLKKVMEEYGWQDKVAQFGRFPNGKIFNPNNDMHVAVAFAIGMIKPLSERQSLLHKLVT